MKGPTDQLILIILPTTLVDILETTANEDNGDDYETGEEDDDYVYGSDDEE